MVKNHIKDIFISNLKHKPTKNQSEAFEALADFVWDYSNPKADPDKIFLLKGYAGTGKTTIISTIVNST